ncbi:CRISPR-associated ring nuclease Csm6 [Acidiphilium sp.]|uniref:CRISPR-associated ring nuclease Csm6 n=1 Tax=Acidiphilium sp. TaxID=527 RepID=UPI00258A5991|nr:CRISPR-associated ring nuclease Csm6 [Acidiphilium sp.]
MSCATHLRSIFLSAVGLTPQVVTETLYALVTAKRPFVPHEIHLLTTEEGQRRVDLLLKPALQALAVDLNCPTLSDALKPQFVHVIRGADGQTLADIDSHADNEAAANAICSVVRSLTADPYTQLHVSLAGGRKTMSFFLGYALSLYGRQDDALSHVLVNEPFQNTQDFFFPPKIPKVFLDARNRPVRSDEAQLTLAEIPFVRLRQGLPNDLLAGAVSYGETVARVQQALASPRLHLDIDARRLQCQDIEVSLPPLLLAFYTCFILRRTRGTPAGWRDLQAEEISKIYHALHGIDNGRWDRVKNGLPREQDGMKEYFEQKKAALHKSLRSVLGAAAGPYLLRAVGHRPLTRFEVSLEPTAIKITGGDF